MSRLKPRRRRWASLWVLLAVGLLAGPVQGQEISDEARTHFRAGVSFLQDPDGARYEEAYNEFKAAYAASPSPKILGNIGFCALKLERDGEAIDAYSKYLQQVPDVDRDERDQILQDLRTLKSGMVKLTVSSDVPDTLLVDVRRPVRGENVTNVYGPIRGRLEVGIRPGHHQVTVKQGAREWGTWEFDATPGGAVTHAFYAPKVVEQATTSKTNVLPLVVTGVGVVMLAGGAVTGIIALDKVKKLEDKCPNDQCPTSLKSDGDSAKTMARVTDVLLVAGGVTAATGLTWYFLAPSKRETSPSVQTGARDVTPSFACAATGCFGTVSGRF